MISYTTLTIEWGLLSAYAFKTFCKRNNLFSKITATYTPYQAFQEQVWSILSLESLVWSMSWIRLNHTTRCFVTLCVISCYDKAYITVTSQWARWQLKSPAYRLFTEPFVQAQIKENIRAPRHGPLCGNSPVTGEFPALRPVTRKMFPFDDIIKIIKMLGCIMYFISASTTPTGIDNALHIDISVCTWHVLK